MMRIIALMIVAVTLTTASFGATLPTPPTFYPTVERIIAIGDLHGDLNRAQQVFQMAEITDQNHHWIAGDLVVVQTGDLLDRGDQEQALLQFLNQLQDEAIAAGGQLHLLNGNHELMNTRLDLRYVTPGGFADFEDAVTTIEPDSLLKTYPENERARVAAFRPGGPFALLAAENNTILMIGENLFAHGGVLPSHLDYGLEKLNREIQLWLAGEMVAPKGIHTSQSPTWTRIYSDEPTADHCHTLNDVLTRSGAARMIVGHTVQENGIISQCNEQVWCIDSGLAEYYGGPINALEIIGDKVRVLR